MPAQPAPRSIWTGSITFGLVNIPVRLYSAVREQNIHFHLLHDQDHARLKRKMVCSVDGKEVHPEHTVKGYEVAPDQYVVVRQEELEAIEPKKTKTIEIQDFVSLGEIDPVYFDRSYYVAPQETGVKAYRLLVWAMQASRRVGIARFVMHNKEYLAALRPLEGALCLETMHFGDEVLPLQSVAPPGAAKQKPDERELKVAQQLIDSLSSRFKPEKYRDEYRQAVEDMVKKKAHGEEVVTPPQAAEAPSRVTDLMAALQASLRKAKGESRSDQRRPHGQASPRRRRKAS